MVLRGDDERWAGALESAEGTSGMGAWERQANLFAADATSTRATFLKAAAGLGLSGFLFAACGTSQSRGPVKAGTLTMAHSQDATTLDPHKTAQIFDAEVMAHIYDSLVYLDEAGKAVPGLALAWRFSDEDKTLTFKLRSGVKFHDGTPFNADAVKFSMDRWIDPKTAGASAFVAGPLEKTTVLAEDEVALHFKEPFGPVLVNLASPFAGIVGPAAVKELGDRFGRNPVGTGAYKFASWQSGTIKLERNAAHTWFSPAMKRPDGAPVERVEVRTVPNPATRIAGLKSNQIGLLAGFQAVPIQQVASLERDSNLDVKTHSFPGVPGAICLNATKAPFTDVRIRQAVSYAIDRKKVVDIALAGQGKPATSVLSSDMAALDPSVAPYYEHDPEKARSLLQEAGQDGGVEFEFVTVAEDDVAKTAAEVIQEDLAKLDIRMSIKSIPGTLFAAKAAAGPLKDRPVSWLGGWLGGDPDVIRFAYTAGGFDNSFDDPKLNAWLDDQSVIIDPEQRKAVLVRIQEHMAKQCYNAPLFEMLGVVASQTYVKDARADYFGYFHPQEMTLV